MDARLHWGEPLVIVRIFVEGGGNDPNTLTLCRRGFGDYCNRLSPSGRTFKILACGGRDQAFRDFKNALKHANGDDVFALLVDSEGPIPAGLRPKEYLAKRDSWSFQGLDSGYVFLMVQAMEAWFLADRAALVTYFGQRFRVNSLPGREQDVEAILKQDLVSKLETASRGLKDGGYHKTRNAFKLLALIDPAKVEAGSPRAAEFHKFLRGL
jgi:hypothetical protein